MSDQEAEGQVPGSEVSKTQPEVSVASQQLEDLKNAVLGLVQRIAFEPKTRARYGKTISCAFAINEDLIRKLDSRATQSLSQLVVFNEHAFFSSEVRFPDLTKGYFQDLTELFDKAAEKRDPESLTLNWRAVLEVPIAEMAYVSINFITEKPLETDELSFLEFHRARVELEIGGPNQEWVDSTCQIILPILEVTKIGGIYKPLLIFRNRQFIHIISWLLAVTGQVVAFETIADKLRGPKKHDIANAILSKTTIVEKFNEWIKYMLLDSRSMTEPLMIFGGGMLFFGICLFGGFWLFPQLVPRSSIEIGLASLRISRYRNAFNLIVFTIILSGLLLPLLRKLLGF